MSGLFFSALAREDLQQIALYIARDNPDRARTFVSELQIQCTRLVDQPDLGVSHEDCAKGLRMISHGRYLIFYCRNESGILVERVLHSARDIVQLFELNRDAF